MGMCWGPKKLICVGGRGRGQYVVDASGKKRVEGLGGKTHIPITFCRPWIKESKGLLTRWGAKCNLHKEKRKKKGGMSDLERGGMRGLITTTWGLLFLWEKKKCKWRIPGTRGTKERRKRG